MSFRYPVIARTKQFLDALANPVAANQPEAVAWVFWDTLLYTSAATTAQVFFQAVNVDKSLGNIVSQGQLPDPQYFQIYNVGLDILQTKSNTAAAGTTVGAFDNIAQLTTLGRGWAQLNISGKAYFQVPLSFLHCSGGPTGVGYGTVAASQMIEFANNSLPDGGLYLGGGVVIPPKQAFDISLSWPVAVTLTGNLNIRIWMAGVLHRRVL
jgi:hypothetical protein